MKTTRLETFLFALAALAPGARAQEPAAPATATAAAPAAPTAPAVVAPPKTYYDSVELIVKGKAKAAGAVVVVLQSFGGEPKSLNVNVLAKMGEDDIVRDIAKELTVAAGNDYKVKTKGNRVTVSKASKTSKGVNVSLGAQTVPGIVVSFGANRRPSSQEAEHENSRRVRSGFRFSLSAAQGPQAGTGSPATPTPLGPPPIIVYRIELVPTGFMFAMNEPVLNGDLYVFRALPERTEMTLPKVKVKSVARWSTDYTKEVVWQVDLAGTSGVHLARNEPVKKGKNWVAYTWKNNTLVSVPETDVVKISRLTGRDAFRAEQLALGLIVLEGESMESGFKGGNAPVNVPAPPPPAPAPEGSPDGNWVPQGVPGATDGYRPAGGTVARPGDTPMAPRPH